MIRTALAALLALMPIAPAKVEISFKSFSQPKLIELLSTKNRLALTSDEPCLRFYVAGMIAELKDPHEVFRMPQDIAAIVDRLPEGMAGPKFLDDLVWRDGNGCCFGCPKDWKNSTTPALWDTWRLVLASDTASGRPEAGYFAAGMQDAKWLVSLAGSERTTLLKVLTGLKYATRLLE